MQFRAMVDSVPGIVMTSVPGSRRDYVCPWLYAFTGLPRKAADGRGRAAALHPGDVAGLLAARREADASGAPANGECRFRAADGSCRWSAVRKASVADEHGRIARRVGAGVEIDVLMRAQEEADRANGRLQMILASISECFFGLDRDWCFTEINSRAAAFFGVDAADVLGRSYLEAFPWARGTPIEDRLRAVLGGRGAVCTERPSLHRPGRWLENHVYPKADGVSVLFRDITERKMAEMEAQRTRELLQSTLDALSAHIAILDGDGRIVSVNAAWQSYATENGYACENHGVGSNYLAVCDAAAATCREAGVMAAGLRAVRDGEQAEFRCDYPCQGKEQQWFQARITRFSVNGAVHLVVAHEDITVVKLSEQAVHQLAGQLLVAQDVERRRIARELHDSTAQNLLCASLAVERALRLTPDLPKETHAALQEAQELIRESQDEIRTVSYLLHPPMLDEAGLASALRWYVSGFTRRSGVDVTVRVAEDVADRQVPADVERALFRIVQEALTNVHRHSGSPTARISLALVGAPGSESVRLEIEDDGRGLPEDAEIAQSGVGLMGMRERIRQIGGDLDVLSLDTSGTTIVASVPMPDGLPSLRSATGVARDIPL